MPRRSASVPSALPILNEALGALKCVPGGSVPNGDQHGVRGEVKTAVLHRDGAALEPAKHAWQIRRLITRGAPLRKDPARLKRRLKDCQPKPGCYLCANAEDRIPTSAKSKSPCAAACAATSATPTS